MYVLPGDMMLFRDSEPVIDGVSIILCCYNSERRLRATLEALAAQILTGNTLVEVLLVDNASTDNTAETAKELWTIFNSDIPLKVIHEAKPGLIHARQAGMHNSTYEILLFCDDDNLISPGYLATVYKHFKSRPDLAALGGTGIPAFESAEPEWFKHFASAYATGSQHITAEDGRVLNLYGAGLSIRKSALRFLYSKGYQPLLTGRKGSTLIGGEDTEMTYALAIAGFVLDYDDTLQFHHVLPDSRLEYTYLQRLIHASAADGPIRNLYHAYATRRPLMSLMKYWPFHLLIASLRIPKYLLLPPKRGFRALYFDWNLRYMISLIAFLPRYNAAKRNIEQIPSYKRPNTHQSDGKPAAHLSAV